MANTIKHFSHPEHQLLLTSMAGNFKCDMCRITGTGVCYRCDTCDFDLHESCTTYPQFLSFFAHPWHTLSLADHSTSNADICDLCREPVGGFWYKCTTCGFDLHTHCSLSSRMVRTKFHPKHTLTLVPTSGSCSACKEDLTVWTYRCGICDVNLHYKCLFAASSNLGGVIADGNSEEKNTSQQGR